MNLLEYAAKELLVKEGVPVAQYGVAETPEAAFDIACKLTKRPLVVKAQIAAGGEVKEDFLMD
ncbi:ATP-grasp domain-containing protein [Methylacidiphilum kamchatkense Kam1]|uniref:ATP-grasp domain-containing protein n=1 Tax=Methylacidiphilum kamchatkense Kam1 TaxID=1202785 RepID=A0A516TM24_9BACT|nr:ATP-grasp domain-containing protein [Methylacidiphilum kamchatkense Kam1]